MDLGENQMILGYPWFTSTVGTIPTLRQFTTLAVSKTLVRHQVSRNIS